MPIEIKDCDGGTGNTIIFRGIIADQEYVDSIERHLRQDKEKFSKYRFSLNDYTAVTKLDVTNESIQFIVQICKEVSRFNPDPIVAIAASGDHVYGLSRMYEALVYGTGWEIMVFRFKEEAVEWIKERVKDKFGIDDLTFG